ncbi:TPA: hypothetical protein RG395_000730 [Legionella pneumophila]|uniref:hypothetical protein n=1 Tax=Legionella pneumophila TaxID=446 RepID=UPI000788A1C0|nr:hypothetical protein [Legionella pneumophila]MDW8877688.1 hypothetical protein [Legionella pneumophila subsp. fraseri]MDW8960727.1 hypothetical protein [Legionella pneumophila subsp. fraseri]MDW9035250.1 hypothetical protein [Legionella pneumophila subsp. fraseri]MDW9038311.1 hypothetical protein [Legionella pneumophila subsp. fraseri]MDW9041372.1 hypothetical protein [Legionella pneumophila subsp. fraseri]
MLLTLALVILFATIMVFFSQEFIRAFKKIFAIRGAKLLIPLGLASWLIYNFDYLFIWAIYYIREVLHAVLSFLTRVMPFKQYSTAIALIILLTTVSVGPVLLLDLINRKRTYKGYAYPYLTSTLILIFCTVILLVVS